MRAAALLALPALLACGHVPLQSREVSRGRSALATAADVPVCGHSVTLELHRVQAGGRGDGTAVERRGELVAATPHSLTILGDEGLSTLAAGEVRRVLVEVRPSRVGTAALTTVGGALSTVSNGVFLVFTFPAWVLAGSLAIGQDAAGNRPAAGPADAALPAYARFPQGLPPGWPAPGQAPVRCSPSPSERRLEPVPAPAADPAAALPAPERS